MRAIIVLVVLASGCIETETEQAPKDAAITSTDPTGHWLMTIAWTTGSCDPSALAPVPTNLELDAYSFKGQFLIPASPLPNTEVVGTFTSNVLPTTANVVERYSDVLGDGSLQASFSINATNTDESLVGFGVASFFGTLQCQQQFALSGTVVLDSEQDDLEKGAR